ncbi:MAG: hypothetical protein ACTSV1_00995 [Alphaproteobacteria bacterium]
MNEWLGLDPDFPIFYAFPLLVFGPIFLLVLYYIGLKEIINPSAEVRARRHLAHAARQRAKADRDRKLKAAGLYRAGLERTPRQWLGQALTYALFALVVAWFSSSPAYVASDPELALIKLSLTHPGQRKEPCRKMTAEELQQLAANMRTGLLCSRERWPLLGELVIDGQTLYRGSARPAGLAADGHSSFYEKFPVATGEHHIVFRLNDSGGDGYDYVIEARVELSTAQILVVSFDNQRGRLMVGD